MRAITICLIAAALLAAGAVSAQSRAAVEYYLTGDDDQAAGHLQKEPGEPSMTAFYLGEIALAGGDTLKAKEHYNEGLAADPKNPYNRIGLAKLLVKSDLPAAETLFGEILKGNRKKAAVHLAVARAWLECGEPQRAALVTEGVKKFANREPGIYLLEGDIILSLDDPRMSSDALHRYDTAIELDSAYMPAYIKAAKVYEPFDTRLSIARLKTAVGKRPDCIPACGYLGQLYTSGGFYPPAIEMFRVYFASGVYSVADIERYARVLYFTGRYPEAMKRVAEGLEREPEHFVLNRYRMYILAREKNVAEGFPAAQLFFALRDSTGYLAHDYMMHAMLLAADKRFGEAIARCGLALALERDKPELYAEAAAIARLKKDYPLAAGYVEDMMETKARLAADSTYKDDPADINALGYDCYCAGIAEQKNGGDARHWLERADSLFGVLIERVPDSYTGYRLRALARHAINPDAEQGYAKPWYEKVFGILAGREELSAAARRVLLEACNYLGYYHYLKSDKTETVMYWSKVRELDPDNANAKLVLEEMEKK